MSEERYLGGPVRAQCRTCGAEQHRLEGVAFACVACGNTNPPPYRTPATDDDETKETTP